ncbi:Na/Pi cotransporter family protein [Musicola paradisiaca]|uniref:Sodium-dependent inorganic phosphate (Pi) transporter n=1 Tax=Musicola paradisiaca (strain Ech703) TaxID=579405 RepID=C6C8Q1_MUSP7|nr:Na/Pi cotransporter family protein [Musicola paradisiaca]ACS84272.1 sodium-dependent inorganic phosphate (Pi) transporter [Musicola paradisiaca Ech703]
MLTLLHLLSAIALLVWGTHIARTGIMRVYGARLRRAISASVSHKPLAFLAGLGVTALVQSSNATALLTTSFVSQGLIALTPALVILLGADVGTALMVRVMTFDLSWLSPLLIFLGVVLFLSRKQMPAGQIGRAAIGFGLILLALELIVQAATPITQAAGVKVMFSTLTGDILLDALLGALFAIVSYSSLAAVLLTATLTASHVISLEVALCLVIGANLGSGILAMINTSAQGAAARRVALGSMLFKLIGSLPALPAMGYLADGLAITGLPDSELVIYFHLSYNLIRCLLLLPFAESMSKLCSHLIAMEQELDLRVRPKHLDNSALETPALALANAARETLRMGDIVEQMLLRFQGALHGSHQQMQGIRRLNEDLDVLYNAIKLYLAQIDRVGIPDHESQRWAEVIETAMDMEQSGDIIERIIDDINNDSLGVRRSFSLAGMNELNELYALLVENLRLSMSVFLSGDSVVARRLRRSKHRFRILSRRYSHSHVERLHQQNVQSLETSSLHLSMLGDMNRLNSLFCSVAYSVLMASEDEDNEREGSTLSL